MPSLSYVNSLEMAAAGRRHQERCRLAVYTREKVTELYLRLLSRILHIFVECDCISYLRNESWYLEQIKVLECTHPELYW